MPSFVLSGSDSDLTLPFGIANKRIFVGAEGVAHFVGGVPAISTKWLYLFTDAADANRPDGNLGTLVTTLRMFQDFATNFLQVSVALARVNAGGVIQLESAYTAAQSVTDVQTTFTFTNTNPDLGFWATNDRMVVEVKVENVGLSGRNIDIETGGTTVGAVSNLVPAPPLLVAHY